MAAVKPVERAFLIVVQEPGPHLREAIQEMVKQNASRWWHQMADVWIVEGQTAKGWRDRILPLRTAAQHKDLVLVIELPSANSGSRWWAASGQTGLNEFDWLHAPYTRAEKE